MPTPAPPQGPATPEPAAPPVPAAPGNGAAGPAGVAPRAALGLALVAVLAVVAVVAALAWPGDAEPARSGDWPPNVELVPPEKRGTLPAWRGEDVVAARGQVDLAALRGRPLVLNFWASWCGPCRAEQRGLERASRELAPAGVGFVGVNVRDDRAAAAAYLAEFAVSYPSLYDRPGDFVQALGADAPPAPPTTLVVDAEGRIAARVLGVLPGEDPAAQAATLARLVRAATGAGTGP
jgi:thiol-disulfide isomerase/thioredoxin